MKIVLSTVGTFHLFDLARYLHKHEMLERIFTAYPGFKLENQQLPRECVKSHSWLYTPYMALNRYHMHTVWSERESAYWIHRNLDRYVARHLPPCDILFGHSGSSLRAGTEAQRRGAKYICDRGSSHIRFQTTILEEENRRQGISFQVVDPRCIPAEEAEYAKADAISVPSTYARRSFIEQGVPPEKVCVIPYGVDLDLFYRDGAPADGAFEVLFAGTASLLKGVPDLLAAFSRVEHPRKTLTFVGAVSPHVRAAIERAGEGQNVVCTGPVPRSRLREIMSRSHVMVLPSIDEGFGMVQAEAMACGCPVIASTNTGAADLFEDGVQGFIVPIRDPETLAERMQRLACNSELQRTMSEAALLKVQNLGGWDSYGASMVELFRRVAEVRS